MSIQGDVIKGSQARSVCLPYFPFRAGHFALKDNTTKMKAEIGTHAPTVLRSRDALGQQQHRNKVLKWRMALDKRLEKRTNKILAT